MKTLNEFTFDKTVLKEAVSLTPDDFLKKSRIVLDAVEKLEKLMNSMGGPSTEDFESEINDFLADKANEIYVKMSDGSGKQSFIDKCESLLGPIL